MVERRSHGMSPARWQALDAIAEDLGAVASTGTRHGQASWRTMLRQVADGYLVVTHAVALEMLADVIKAINRLEVKPRSAGAKRRILARLRAAHVAHEQGQEKG